MKKNIVFIIISFFFIQNAYSLKSQFKPLINQVSEAEFKERVLNSFKPCVVKFTATWCEVCSKMKPIDEQLAQQNSSVINPNPSRLPRMKYGSDEVVRRPAYDPLPPIFEPQVLFFEVDIDANKQLAQKYNIKSVPTYFFIKNGNIVHKKIGEMKPEEYQSNINKIKN